MIEVSHLTKSYGLLHVGRATGERAAIKAVDDISFRVDKGEVIGFLGPNGAGKSTTLRILAGFLGATSGRILINGFDIGEEPMKARASVGYMPETSPLYPEMRVSEYLRFRAELKPVPRRARKEAVARALYDARIEDVAETMIGHLSKGYKQRVGLADALLGSPPLLILDEPTAGLDPNQIREVRELLRKLGREHTVLLSTHILSEVEATCTRAILIARGRLVAQGTIEEIRAMQRAQAVKIKARGEAERARRAASGLSGLKGVEVRGAPEGLVLEAAFEAGADAGRATEALVSALVGAGIGVREVLPFGASLEQVFAALTTEDAEERRRGGEQAPKAPPLGASRAKDSHAKKEDGRAHGDDDKAARSSK